MDIDAVPQEGNATLDGTALTAGQARVLSETGELKVGDRVIFGKYAGQTVKVDGEELLVMREEDIMGVVEA